MERIKIEANLRKITGKETAKKIRREGGIPAVIYGGEINLAVKIPSKEIKSLQSIHFSKSAIVDIEIKNGEKKEVYSTLIKDIQYHPLSEAVIHIDFIRVSLKEKIRVEVPIILKGEPKGVKEEGGILEQILWKLSIESLPLEIPEKIEVDISNLGIGDSIHVSDIKLEGNLRIITSPDETIATVVAKKEEEVVAPTTETQEVTGPEVIKEKKEAEETEIKEESKKEEKG